MIPAPSRVVRWLLLGGIISVFGSFVFRFGLHTPQSDRADSVTHASFGHSGRPADGSNKTLPAGATGADLARAVGPGLAKAALAIRVNGEVRDLQRPLPDGAKVSILTNKDPQALDVLRHSSAHALATAVRQLFPQAQIGFGRRSKTVLLRLRYRGGHLRPRTSRGDRKEDGRGRQKRITRSFAKRCRALKPRNASGMIRSSWRESMT